MDSDSGSEAMSIDESNLSDPSADLDAEDLDLDDDAIEAAVSGPLPGGRGFVFAGPGGARGVVQVGDGRAAFVPGCVCGGGEHDRRRSADGVGRRYDVDGAGVVRPVGG